MPVVVMQPSSHSVISNRGGGPNSHIYLSLFTLFLINPPFGLVATILSCMSRSAASHDYETARIRGKVAMFIAIAGIVISVLGGLVFVMVYFTRDT